MFIYTLGKHVTSTEFPEVRYVCVSLCMAGIHIGVLCQVLEVRKNLVGQRKRRRM